MVPFVLEGQCTTAKGVGPLLEQILSVRGTGTHPLGMGVVSVSAAQQGALCCQPDLLGRKEKLPRGRGVRMGVNARTGHLQDTAGGLLLGLQRRISLGAWQQKARHGTKEPLSLVCLCW